MALPFKNFRGLWRRLVPSWLNSGEGELVGYTLMWLNDISLERIYLGHLARFPQNGPNGETAPTDALAALGRDRGVIRGIDETDASYAYRLTQWLVDARTRGTAFTLMKQLAAYCDWDGSKGCSFRVVDSRGNWYSRSATGVETSSLDTGNWNWDGEEATRWARFYAIVYPGTRWVEGPDWGDSTWGATNETWGTTATPEHVATMKEIVADGKPAGTNGAIIIAFDDASFDPTSPEPDGTWGRPYYGADAPPSRLATARYIGV